MSENNHEHPVILIVEDNPPDVFLLRRTLQAHFKKLTILVAENGEKAFHFLEQAHKYDEEPCPELLVLDLNLPKKNGFEILQRFRESAKCRHIPVVIFTSSDSEGDRARAAMLGVTRYVLKPSSLDAFLEVGGIIREVFINHSKS